MLIVQENVANLLLSINKSRQIKETMIQLIKLKAVKVN